MTKLELRSQTPSIHNDLDAIIAKIGLFKTVLALLRRIFRPKIRPPDDINDLNAHLRKDIGLPPHSEQSGNWWKPPF